MESVKTLDSSILSLVILTFIYYNARNRTEKVFMNHKIFLYLVLSNIILIILDIGSWIFDGLPGSYYMMANKGFNLLLFIVEPITGTLWNFYVHYQVLYREKHMRKIKIILYTLFAMNGIMSIVSMVTGYFFWIDSNNIYYRGNLYWIHIVYCYLLLAYSMYYVFKNRKLIEKRYYYSMLTFVLPIAIGATIQIIFYGMALAWSGMMVSLLIIYFNIQDRGLNTDYLTGVYNRRQLDKYLKVSIKNSAKNKSFSAILIDLDGFKKINDTFGHDVGDEALKEATQIIRKSLGKNDFIARYGGDEFFIIIDNSDKNIVEGTVEKLRSNVEKFNNESEKEYKLSFAIGYAIYDNNSKMESDDFFRYIDELMYNNKNFKRKS